MPLDVMHAIDISFKPSRPSTRLRQPSRNASSQEWESPGHPRAREVGHMQCGEQMWPVDIPHRGAQFYWIFSDGSKGCELVGCVGSVSPFSSFFLYRATIEANQSLRRESKMRQAKLSRMVKSNALGTVCLAIESNLVALETQNNQKANASKAGTLPQQHVRMTLNAFRQEMVSGCWSRRVDLGRNMNRRSSGRLHAVFICLYGPRYLMLRSQSLQLPAVYPQIRRISCGHHSKPHAQVTSSNCCICVRAYQPFGFKLPWHP